MLLPTLHDWFQECKQWDILLIYVNKFCTRQICEHWELHLTYFYIIKTQTSCTLPLLFLLPHLSLPMDRSKGQIQGKRGTAWPSDIGDHIPHIFLHRQLLWDLLQQILFLDPSRLDMLLKIIQLWFLYTPFNLAI